MSESGREARLRAIDAAKLDPHPGLVAEILSALIGLLERTSDLDEALSMLHAYFDHILATGTLDQPPFADR